MEEKSSSQLELFSQVGRSASIEKGMPHSYLKFIRKFEKAILMMIAFIVTGIISFSLGVEKGKKITNLKINSQMDMASILPPPAIKQETAVENYTIQIASYQGKTHAQKEATVLKEKGFSPVMLTKSGYIVLCVGNFSNKESARIVLSQLKKRYRDCFIRRL